MWGLHYPFILFFLNNLEDFLLDQFHHDSQRARLFSRTIAHAVNLPERPAHSSLYGLTYAHSSRSLANII